MARHRWRRARPPGHPYPQPGPLPPPAPRFPCSRGHPRPVLRLRADRRHGQNNYPLAGKSPAQPRIYTPQAPQLRTKAFPQGWSCRGAAVLAGGPLPGSRVGAKGGYRARLVPGVELTPVRGTPSRRGCRCCSCRRRSRRFWTPCAGSPACTASSMTGDGRLGGSADRRRGRLRPRHIRPRGRCR